MYANCFDSDPLAPNAASSNGIFVDLAVHDIDLTLWFFGSHVKPKSISAYGVIATSTPASTTTTTSESEVGEQHPKNHPQYGHALGIVEFWDGRIAYYYYANATSTITSHSQEDTMTEVLGPEGKLTIDSSPQKSLLNYSHPSDSGGVTRNVPSNDAWARLEAGFVKEANDFTAACLDDSPLPLDIRDAVRIAQMAAWLQEALVSGQRLSFDEQGRRQEKARL